MSLTKEKKKKVIGDYKTDKHDTGSSEVQIALLTERINELSEHFKSHVKDHHSRYGLIKLVGQRKSLLSYLNRINPESYKKLIARLDLRK
jgi:small subunit ribosomal protein S15